MTLDLKKIFSEEEELHLTSMTKYFNSDEYHNIKINNGELFFGVRTFCINTFYVFRMHHGFSINNCFWRTDQIMSSYFEIIPFEISKMSQVEFVHAVVGEYLISHDNPGLFFSGDYDMNLIRSIIRGRFR